MSTNYSYMITAAKHSKYNAKQWMRYLRKVILEEETLLSQDDIEMLNNSTELTDFQKVSLRRALDKTSPTHEYVVGLNKKAKITSLEQVMKKHDELK